MFTEPGEELQKVLTSLQSNYYCKEGDCFLWLHRDCPLFSVVLYSGYSSWTARLLPHSVPYVDTRRRCGYLTGTNSVDANLTVFQIRDRPGACKWSYSSLGRTVNTKTLEPFGWVYRSQNSWTVEVPFVRWTKALWRWDWIFCQNVIQ